MNISIDSIIFDVDGTLWDSTETVARSWNQAIREHSQLDMHIDAHVLSKVFGKTMDEIGDILFPSLPPSQRRALLDICYEYENALLETKPGVLYPHVSEVFKQLSSRYPLYIVSNCQCGYIEVMLRTTGLENYVKDTLCYGQTMKKKGDTIRMLMARNSLSHSIYVGDTKGDQIACLDASIPFIFASYGFGKDVHAEYTIDSLQNLPSLLQHIVSGTRHD